MLLLDFELLKIKGKKVVLQCKRANRTRNKKKKINSAKCNTSGSGLSHTNDHGKLILLF